MDDSIADESIPSGTSEYWVDEKGNLHPKPHKVKGRWQETARDLVLFPLLKLAALILALIILGGIASGSGSFGGGEELSETSIVSVIMAGIR